MRTLLSLAILMSASVSAFAAPEFNVVPEPESLGLVAAAAVAVLVAKRRK